MTRFLSASVLRHVVPVLAMGAAVGMISAPLSQAQPFSSEPSQIQVPQCSIQLTGFNTGASDVRVTRVQVIDGAQSDRIVTPMGQLFVAGGPKVVRGYTKLPACPRGRLEVSLEMTSTPVRTALFRASVPAGGQGTVDMGDVNRLF